jgi:hypothetical protein
MNNTAKSYRPATTGTFGCQSGDVNAHLSVKGAGPRAALLPLAATRQFAVFVLEFERSEFLHGHVDVAGIH